MCVEYICRCVQESCVTTFMAKMISPEVMVTIAMHCMTIRSVDWSGKLKPLSIQLHVRLSFAFPGVKVNSYALTPIYINTGR